MKWSLSTWALVLGVAMALGGLAAALAPGPMRKALAAFPRHVPSAWVLAALNMAWISAIVFHAPLDRFEAWKPALYVVAPFCFFLLIQYLDELLAPRALGGLLLLLPNPMLNAARWHPSDWRFVITVLAYAFVVAGILLVLGPYRFRRWTAWWIADDGRCRAGGALKAAFGLVLILLAVNVY